MKRIISMVCVFCIVLSGGAALTGAAEAAANESPLKLSFADVEKQVKRNNLTIRNNDITIDNINSMFVEDDVVYALVNNQNELRAMQNRTVAALNIMGQSTPSSVVDGAIAQALQNDYANLEISIVSISSQIDQIYDAPRASRDKTVQQLNNVNKQIVWGAESLYMGYHTLLRQLDQTKENLKTLDRNIAIMERRLSIGQITEHTLQSLKNSRTQLVNGIKSIENELGNLKAQLNMLIGRKHDAPLDIGTMPAADRDYLKSIDKEKDLKTAKRNNSTINIAIIDIDEQGKKSSESARRQEAIAQNNYDNEMRVIEQKFESLTAAISDKEAFISSAEAQLAHLQQSLNETQKRYALGIVSKATLEQAESDVFLQTLSVKSAEADFFNTIRRYEWFVLGLII